MKSVVIALLLAGFALTAATADGGKGYTLQNSQNIMHFVAIDEDRARDVDVYRQAVRDLCQPDTRCQVLFWIGKAPNGLPMTREQTRSKVAYWQYSRKTGKHHLYVDCGFFGEIEDAECL